MKTLVLNVNGDKYEAKAEVGDAMPLSKNSYKVPIIEALVKRTLLE